MDELIYLVHVDCRLKFMHRWLYQHPGRTLADGVGEALRILNKILCFTFKLSLPFPSPPKARGTLLVICMNRCNSPSKNPQFLTFAKDSIYLLYK